MLIPREQLKFDFQGAEFDLSQERERKFLAWVFNQFLYGEVTGIQCGHWLYHAPHLNAAQFIAKQASEELSHVRKILRILSLLGESPGPAHGAIRFLSTGMMGGSWGEHVTLEMALGEGLVLTVFYAMADTISQPEIRKILESAVIEEERHVIFGERESMEWLKKHPEDRPRLLALALVQLWALHRLKGFLIKRAARELGENHPVLSRFGQFFDHVLWGFGARIERLGLSTQPVSRMNGIQKGMILFALPFRQLRAKLRRRPRLLTTTYLADPLVLAEKERAAELGFSGSQS